MKQFGLDKRTFKIFPTGYITIAFFGAALLSFEWAHTKSISFIDAFSISTSVVSMTGLVVKSTAADSILLGQIIILALAQIGGLGYMGIGLFVYILVRKKVDSSGRNLLKGSLLYPSMDGIFRFFKKVLLFIFIIELIGTVLFTLRFALEMNFLKALWFGLFHAVSVFNNSGSILLESGLLHYKHDLVINLLITSLVAIGGLGYFVIIEFYFSQKKHLQSLSLHTKIVIFATIFFIIFSTLITSIFEYSNVKNIGEFSFFDKLLASYFAVVNYRTSGFNTLDIANFKDASLFFGSLFMVVGGAPGGTAGGMKVTTVMVLLLYAYWTLRNGRVGMSGYEIPQETINEAFVIATGSTVYIVVAAISISLLETDFRFIALFSETSSTFATVGLSVGGGGTPSLCVKFHDTSKIIIIIMMTSGRIGVFAFFLSMFNQDKVIHLRYPQDGINL